MEDISSRLIDLSYQAYTRDHNTYSNFLNLNDINILYNIKSDLYTDFILYGGYEKAERQIVAFTSDALFYKENLSHYPIKVIEITPVAAKFAEKIGHRDILGTVLSLGCNRDVIGDIIVEENRYLLFCHEKIAEYIRDELYKIRHTQVKCEIIEINEVEVNINYTPKTMTISSNRLDAFVSGACNLSRSKSSELILSEKVFINSKLISNHNQSIKDGDIISIRGFGKLVVDSTGGVSKKGRSIVSFRWYN